MRLQEVAKLTGHTDVVWNVAWSPEGDLLASCGGDKSVRIWGAGGAKSDEWTVKAVLDDGHERTVRRIAWSPDGLSLASASFDSTTVVWQRKNKSSTEFENVATLEGPENEVKGVAWDSAGTLLATCSRDKSVWVWEAEADGEFECIAVMHGHSQDVKSVLFHPSAELLLSCSYDDSIKVWRDDDDDWYCASTLTGHQSTVWDIAFNSDGSRLASCSDDLSVIIWDTSSLVGGAGGQAKRVSTLSGEHKRCVYSVSWSLDGVLATGAADDTIRLFAPVTSPDLRVAGDELDSYALKASLPRAHHADINSVRFSPSDATLLASCSDDHTIRLWRLILDDDDDKDNDNDKPS